MNGSIEFSERREGGTVTIRLAGALDEEAARAIESRLFAVIEDDAVDQVCLDLGGITFVDSTGLGLLVRTARRAIREEKSFTVAELSDVMESQFERARLRALMVGPTPRPQSSG